jgi:hypothetical protein
LSAALLRSSTFPAPSGGWLLGEHSVVWTEVLCTGCRTTQTVTFLRAVDIVSAFVRLFATGLLHAVKHERAGYPFRTRPASGGANRSEAERSALRRLGACLALPLPVRELGTGQSPRCPASTKE